MSKVAVVYHSGYGHTAEVAKAVARGAAGIAGIDAQLISVADVDKQAFTDALLPLYPTLITDPTLRSMVRRIQTDDPLEQSNR